MVGPGYGSPLPWLDQPGAVESGNATEIAAAGVAGTPQALPHAEAIQRSFGSHDVSGTRTHVGGGAAEAADAFGAEAFATGNEVGFRESPDLHTAAHEAAHVVQQRGGVQLKDGVGQVGDAYEQHADAVADRVVAGQSAQGLLDQMAGTSVGGSAASSRDVHSPGIQSLAVQLEGGHAAAAVRHQLAIGSSGDTVVAKGTRVTYSVDGVQHAGDKHRYEWSVENDAASVEKAGPRSPYCGSFTGPMRPRGPSTP